MTYFPSQHLIFQAPSEATRDKWGCHRLCASRGSGCQTHREIPPHTRCRIHFKSFNGLTGLTKEVFQVTWHLSVCKWSHVQNKDSSRHLSLIHLTSSFPPPTLPCLPTMGAVECWKFCPWVPSDSRPCQILLGSTVNRSQVPQPKLSCWGSWPGLLILETFVLLNRKLGLRARSRDHMTDKTQMLRIHLLLKDKSQNYSKLH